MFRQNDFLDYLETQFSYEFSPNTWKAHNKDESVSVVMEGGTNGSQVTSPSIQFLVRSKSELQCEGIAFELYDFFDYKTNYSIGETHVVLSRGQQASPIYTGKDENERHIYSLNLVFIVSKNS